MIKGYEHLKLSKIIKGNGVYRRFLNFIDGYENAITKGEFEQFEKEYLSKHDKTVKWIDKTYQKNNFKPDTK